MFYAKKRLKIDGAYREIGAAVPEAYEWHTARNLLKNGELEWRDDGPLSSRALLQGMPKEQVAAIAQAINVNIGGMTREDAINAMLATIDTPDSVMDRLIQRRHLARVEASAQEELAELEALEAAQAAEEARKAESEEPARRRRRA